jgi:hypothetical protein
MSSRLITFLGFLGVTCLLLWWTSTLLRPTFEFAQGAGSGSMAAVSSGGLLLLLLLLTILGLALVGVWTLARAIAHTALRITKSRK